MDSRWTFSALAKQFAIACALCTGYFLFFPDQEAWEGIFPLVLLPYALAVCTMNRLYLRKSRTLRSLLLVNGAALLFLEALIWCWDRRGGWAEAIFQVLFSLVITYYGIQLARSEPSLRSMIGTVDMSFLVLLACVGLVTAIGRDPVWCLPSAAGCAAAVLGLAARRTSRRLRGREWLVMGLAFAGLLGAAWLLLSWAAVPAGQGLVALWNGAVSLIKKIARLLWRGLLWLASLFPQPGAGSMPEPEAGLPPPLEEPAEESSPVLFVILAVLLAAAALIGLVVLLRRLGKIRLGGEKTVGRAESRGGRRRISLWAALKRFWTSWLQKWHGRLWLRKHWKTPEGLYCFLIRRCRMKPWRKKLSETPREFLRRLQGTFQDDEELGRALEELIPAVETALYSSRGIQQKEGQAHLIRRHVGKAARRLRRHLAAEKSRNFLGRGRAKRA